MPFGTPTDTNLNTVKNFMTGKDIGWIPKYKVRKNMATVGKTGYN